jgi:hypothetical protein
MLEKVGHKEGYSAGELSSFGLTVLSKSYESIALLKSPVAAALPTNDSIPAAAVSASGRAAPGIEGARQRLVSLPAASDRLRDDYTLHFTVARLPNLLT